MVFIYFLLIFLYFFFCAIYLGVVGALWKDMPHPLCTHLPLPRAPQCYPHVRGCTHTHAHTHTHTHRQNRRQTRTKTDRQTQTFENFVNRAMRTSETAA